MSVAVSIPDSPMQLSSNFVLSCESNNITGYTVGDPVPTWVDNSGVGNNLVQTGTKRPTYNIDAFGFSCLDFSQSNYSNYQSTILYPQQNNITVVLALRVDEFVSGYFKQLFLTNSSPLCDRIELQNATRRLSLFINNLSTPNNPTTLSNIYPNTSKCVVTLRRTPTLIECWINFTKVLSVVITSFTPYATTSLMYLCLPIATGDAHINGSFYQAHVCHEALTDQKLKQLIRYTAFKSGIVI